MTSLPPSTEHVLEARAPDEDQVPASHRSLARGVWVAVAVVLLAVVALWLVGGRAETIHYVTEPSSRGPLVVQVTATGTLQPTNQVEVGTEISGKIDRLLVDYNDRVKVGQVLARIDTTRLEAQARQSRAALSAAEARVKQSEASREEARLQLERLTRMRALTADTIPSTSDVDSARAALARADADVESSRAMVQQSEATLEAQETDLRKAVIRSPIDGIVLQRSVEEGQTVAASLQAPVLFVLAEDLKQMELHVDTDEADVASVEAGQHATFTVDAFPDKTFDAQVKSVYFGAKTVNGVVTYETVLVVDNSGLELRPGMTATANIVVRRSPDVLRVPNAALRFAPETSREAAPSGGSLVNRLMPRPPMRGTVQRAPEAAGTRQVWTLRDGRPVAIDVRTGATDGIDTEIVSGELQPGTPLIVDAASGTT